MFPTPSELRRRPSFSRRPKKVSSEAGSSSQKCTGDLVSRLRDNDDGIHRRQLYQERMERARGHRMTQNSFDDILQAIDRPDCDPIEVDGPDESLPHEMDEDQEEGIFVRGREGWVDIDQYAPCKIVFRFKWKRKTSNKSKQAANSTDEPPSGKVCVE